MTAADGKRYATDCFAQDDIIKLIRVIPSPKTADFLDWFIYSDNTIDGQSKKKAYTLIESGVLETMKPGTDWSKIGKRDYLNAMIESEMNSNRIHELLHNALTDRIDDREIFMKGIDYSYYYEQEE